MANDSALDRFGNIGRAFCFAAILIMTVLSMSTAKVYADEVTKEDGGPVQIEVRSTMGEYLGPPLNSESSLRLESVAVKSNLPIKFVETPGIWVDGEATTVAVNFFYKSRTTILAQGSSAVTAFKVGFITFDVFGRRTARLSATEVADIPIRARSERRRARI